MLKRLLLTWLWMGLVGSGLYGQIRSGIHGDLAREVRAFEVEVMLGLGVADHKLGGKVPQGLSVACEGRYNFPLVPIDLGVQAAFTRLVLPAQSKNQWLESGNVWVVSHYNFRSGKDFAYFAGAGLGYCKAYERTGLCFAPCVGVEVARHFRLSAQYRIQKEEHRQFAFMMGYVFGGGLIKERRK